MNIYSNFNGLLFSYSFNLLYWFILVMRNNIMFCGFISFFFLLLNYYYYYLLYGIYEHTLIQIHAFNKFKQAICAVPSLGRVMYGFEMHFSAFW